LVAALSTKEAGVFWENVFGPPQKPWLWTEKTRRQKLRYVWRQDRCEMLRTQALSRRVRSRIDNKDEVFEGKFRNLNFSPSTKKTTEYSFELFLSVYRYLIFFLKF